MNTTTETKSCASCAYWNSTSEIQGECRRQAPQAIVFKVDESTKFETHFPITKSTDWCGEYEEK